MMKQQLEQLVAKHLGTTSTSSFQGRRTSAYPEAAQAAMVCKDTIVAAFDRNPKSFANEQLLSKAIRSHGRRAEHCSTRTIVGQFAYRTAYWAVRNGVDPIEAIKREFGL